MSGSASSTPRRHFASRWAAAHKVASAPLLPSAPINQPRRQRVRRSLGLYVSPRGSRNSRQRRGFRSLKSP